MKERRKGCRPHQALSLSAGITWGWEQACVQKEDWQPLVIDWRVTPPITSAWEPLPWR